MILDLTFLLLIISESSYVAAKKTDCVDIGTASTSKYSCVDYACLSLCHLGHVQKLCSKTCGLCGTDTVDLPSTPASPILNERTKQSAVLSWVEPRSVCKIKQIEYRITPPAKGGKSIFLFTAAKKHRERIVGLFGDISYSATLRVKSSFGWSLPSEVVAIPQAALPTVPSTVSSTVSSKVTSTVTSTAPPIVLPIVPSVPSEVPPIVPPIVPQQQAMPPTNEESHKTKKERLIARANREAAQHRKDIRMRQNQEKKLTDEL